MFLLKDWRRLSLLVFLICYLFFIGCATGIHRLYQGPPLPKGNVAQIINGSGNCILLKSIDGIEGSRCFRAPFATTAKVEILPGDHTLGVYCQIEKVVGGWYSSIKQDVKFKAEPGQTYLLDSKHDLTYLTWFFIIKNEATKEVIVEEGPFPLKFLGRFPLLR